MEYKSPDDYLSIDDFYKVYAYCCLYKFIGDNQNEKKADDITITFIFNHHPVKLLKHLEQEKQMQVKTFDNGIYYLVGDIFPMQLIVTYQLSEEENLWLKNITNHLENRHTAEKLIKEYQKHDQEELYQSVMNIIIQANQETFKEDIDILEVLEELFKDKLEEKRKDGRVEIITTTLANGHTPEQIADFIGIPLEEVLKVQESMFQTSASE